MAWASSTCFVQRPHCSKHVERDGTKHNLFVLQQSTDDIYKNSFYDWQATTNRNYQKDPLQQTSLSLKLELCASRIPVSVSVFALFLPSSAPFFVETKDSYLRNEGLLHVNVRTPRILQFAFGTQFNNRQHDQCGDAPVGFLRRQQRPFQIRLVRGAENRKSSQQLGRKRQERMEKKRVTWKKPPRSTTNNVYVIEQVQCPPINQRPPPPLSASVSASSSSFSSPASLASSGPSSGAVSSSSSSAAVAAPTGVIGKEQTEFIQEFEKGIASSKEGLKNYNWDRVVGLEKLKGVMQEFIEQWRNPKLKGRRKPKRSMLLYG